jgi:hypothetical protein
MRLVTFLLLELVIPASQRIRVKRIMVEAFHEVTEQKFTHHTPKIKWETGEELA